jgi:hypothetical protein
MCVKPALATAVPQMPPTLVTYKAKGYAPLYILQWRPSRRAPVFPELAANRRCEARPPFLRVAMLRPLSWRYASQNIKVMKTIVLGHHNVAIGIGICMSDAFSLPSSYCAVGTTDVGLQRSFRSSAYHPLDRTQQYLLDATLRGVSAVGHPIWQRWQKIGSCRFLWSTSVL